MAHLHNFQRWIVTLLSIFFSCISGTAANYLCITATQPYSSVMYTNRGGNSPDVQYSTDGGETWKELGPEEKVELEGKGDKIYLRGINPDGFSHESLDPQFIDLDRKYTVFLIGGEVAASGSVMSLIDGEGVSTTIPCEHCFAHLFHGANLTSAPELPATTLKDYCYNNMFTSCMGLTQAPELPATTLEKGCYTQMFLGCENLNQAPELPATILAENCYEGMFFNCFALTQAPELPATTLAPYCYSEMFSHTSITKAPELPATTLAPYCYNLMFSDCKNLARAPELPALELAPYCYKEIFFNCFNLFQASELPATVLSEGCYSGMFSRCRNLTEAPELPATTLVNKCYADMFMYCEQLRLIKVGVNTLDNNVDATRNWVYRVDGPGSFIFPCGSKYDKHGASEAPGKFIIKGSPIVIFQNPDSTILYRDTIDCGATPNYVGDTPSAGEGSVFLGWDNPLEALPEPDIYYFTAQYENMGRIPTGDCLRFIAGEDNASFTIENFGGNEPDLEYTTNGGVTWIPLREGETVTLRNAGDKVYVKGYNPDGLSHQESVYTQFKMSGEIAASGSVMSLIDGDSSSTKIPNAYCFTRLFLNSTLTQAPSLPAVSLTESCYDHMFAGSENLPRIPELPASKLEPYCYNYMFAGCIAIDTIKSFTATELAPYCCNSMFTECTKLRGLPEQLPAMVMAEGCYAKMFAGCTSLERAPELPGEILAPRCYASMFSGCSTLNGFDLLPARIMEEHCYASMFENCEMLVQASKMVISELAEGCCESMYKGCTTLSSSPVLAATELKKECYKEMFSGCTNLEYIDVSVMTLDNDFDATLNWVDGVDGLGLFIFPCGSRYDKHGISEVPDKFTIKASPILVFLNPDNVEIWRDTVDCDSVPVYKGPTPTYDEGLVFIGWDKELTAPTYAETFYYIAQYEPSGEVTLGPWLCFTAEEAGSEIWYTNYGENHPDVQYSVNGGNTWEELTPGKHIVLENANQKVYLKGANPNGFSHSSSDNTCFGMSGRITASGNLMSLIGGDSVPSEIPCAHCFDSLFAGCASLFQAPKLPATTLTESCYRNMFAHCTGLKKTPELPVLQLADGCYAYMFQGCTSLILAAELPATTLKERCYYGMFAGCTQLKEAPLLVTDQLVGQCYAHMFENCSSMEYIEVGMMSLDNDVDATDKWVDGVDGPGLFVFPCGTKYDKHGISEVPDKFTIKGQIIVIFQKQDNTELWRDTIDCHTVPQYKGATPTIDKENMVFWKWDKNPKIIDEPGVYYYTAKFRNKSVSPECNYLCFTAETEGASIKYTHPNNVDVEYSTDGGVTWEPWISTYSIYLENEGDQAYVRGNNPDGTGIEDSRFSIIQGFIAASGSVMSLIDGKGETTVIPCPRCFYSLFRGCATLTLAPELPATTLTEECYANMFAECGSLREFPELPATELARACYYNMFYRCWGVKTAPELPATKLAPYCYCNMFFYCDNLIDPPALPATQLEEYCYCNMFDHCASLEKAPALPATQLDTSCYAFMFVDCESLVQAPELPATELADLCYNGMFSVCRALTRAPELPATSLAKGCYSSMFAACPLLSEVPESLPAMELKEACYAFMFAGCDNMTKAPELPATEFKPECYKGMFNYSRGINYIKVGVMTLDNAMEATTAWVEGLLNPGTFIFPCGTTYDKHGKSEVPTNFEIIGYAYTIDSTITAEGSFTKDGITYTESTSWTDFLETIYGCDSIVNYNLIIDGLNPAPVVHRDTAACDLFTFKDAVYTKDATWNDTLHTASGDSIIAYHLTIHKSTMKDSTITAEGSFTREGTTYTENTSWTETLQTIYGCDSIINYHLEIKDITTIPAVFTDKDTSACDVLVFKDITYTQDTSWNDTLQAISGGDSIIVYHLTIHKSAVVDTTVTAMESVTWQGVTYTESASWNDTLQTVNGCDSIIRVNLVVKTVAPPPISVDKMVSACDSFVYDGITYRENSSWNEMLKTASGGDSIVSYRLTIHKSAVVDTTVTAMESVTWQGVTYTESASWSDTLQTVNGCDSIIRVNLVVKTVAPPPISVDKMVSACDSFVYDGITYREDGSWNEMLKTASGADSIVSYRLTIHKSVTKDSSIIAEGSYTWKGTTYTQDASWSDTLQTAFGCDSIVRYSLIVNEEKGPLELTIKDELYLVLPGGSETIFYELAGDEGSKYEVRYGGQTISSGDVTNDSTVSLTCPSSLEPGAYTATMEMCDDEGNCAEEEFTFNVMRPDDKQKSFYVKVWNDVVICRNGDGQFLTYQWYKGRKKCENASQQFFNDVTLLDGAYMVFVSEKSGKSYFIEPITYEPVEAVYAITAEPNVVKKSEEFTVKVTGVAPDDLQNAHIVVYRADGVVEKILDEVKEETVMRMRAGEFVFVLTVNDGKNANCKVLVK